MLPGIGDIHWCMLKMQSLLKANGASHAKIGIWTPNRPRALDYVKRLPFVNEASYVMKPAERYEGYWRKLTQEPGHDLLKANDITGYDYVMGFNASLETGLRIEGILPEYKINWDYPIIETQEDADFGNQIKAKYGDYALVYAPKTGFHKDWSFDVSQTFQTIKATGLTPVLTGAAWDTKYRTTNSIIGQTTTAQLLAVIRRAKLFVGYAAGNGIMATHFKIPTVLMWGEPYEAGFDLSWHNPNSPYVPIWNQQELQPAINEVMNHGT